MVDFANIVSPTEQYKFVGHPGFRIKVESSVDTTMKVLACLCLVLGSLASVRAEQIGTEMTLQLIATFLANSVNNTIQYMLFGKDKFNMEEEVTFWCRTPWVFLVKFGRLRLRNCLYFNRSRSEYIQVLRTDPDITTKLDVTKGLALIVHGYTDNKDRSWMDKMAKAFAIYTDNNACLVDWHTFSNIEYSIAANTVNDVGKSVGDWLLYTAKFIPLNKTSIIGYSLGSHVAGAAGARTGGKLGAIWGNYTIKFAEKININLV